MLRRFCTTSPTPMFERFWWGRKNLRRQVCPGAPVFSYTGQVRNSLNIMNVTCTAYRQEVFEFLTKFNSVNWVRLKSPISTCVTQHASSSSLSRVSTLDENITRTVLFSPLSHSWADLYRVPTFSSPQTIRWLPIFLSNSLPTPNLILFADHDR